MSFGEFLNNRNWSRKAQIVLLTIAGIVWVGNMGDLGPATAAPAAGTAVDPIDTLTGLHVRLYACLMILGIGLAGVFAQCLIDYKHPRPPAGDERPLETADVSEALLFMVAQDIKRQGPIWTALEAQGFAIQAGDRPE